MKNKIILLAILSFVILSKSVFAESQSNHSYRSFGFTQAPVVTVGGNIDISLGKVKQAEGYGDYELINVYDEFGTDFKTDFKNKTSNSRINTVTDANLNFKITGINDYGFKYGAFIELNTISTPNPNDNDFSASKSFIYGESIVGKFEFGNEVGASKKLKVDPTNFARGTGGIKGKYLEYINLPSIIKENKAITSSLELPLFILIPEHPTSHGNYAMGFNNLLYYCDFNGTGTYYGKGDDETEKECYESNSNANYKLNFKKYENAIKLSYYTPEIYGFQAGVSYTPDTGSKGSMQYSGSEIDTGDISEVIEMGINYTETFYGIGVLVGYTRQIGKTESVNLEYKSFRNDLDSSQYGASLTYFGLTFGASIGNWTNSLTYKKENPNIKIEGKAKYLSYGMAYEFNGLNMSATYFESEFYANKFEAYSIALDYQVAKGFFPYIEYTNYEFKPKEIKNAEATIKTNKGTVILIGLSMTF
jgi:hypothetical protein